METQLVTTDSWTAQEGEQGLGQCARWYRRYLRCAQRWTYTDHGVTPPMASGHLLRCSTTKTATTVCGEQALSQSVCDRTP